MQEVRNYIESFVKLSDEEWFKFQSKLQYKKFKKNAFFLKEGAICKHAVFISEGAFRFFKIVKGDEVVTALFFKGDFLSDYQSFLNNQPSLYNIEAIKDAACYTISKSDLDDLFDEYKIFEKLGRLFAERLFLTMNKRLDSFLYETPEQRYADLVKRNSKLLQEVPQYMVASYLGINPETLSRIRKRK
jgi:CRP-like cAMP-binding protein